MSLYTVSSQVGIFSCWKDGRYATTVSDENEYIFSLSQRIYLEMSFSTTSFFSFFSYNMD